MKRNIAKKIQINNKTSYSKV